MTIATRVGELIILEYFDEAEERVLFGTGLTEAESNRRVRLENKRKEAFAAVRETYEKVLRGEYCPTEDPLSLELQKYRNAQSLNHVFLGL